MSKIKYKLQQLVKETVIPQVESYLEEQHILLENNSAKEDDIIAIREMESFLVELENILLVIKEDKLNGNEAKTVFDKIEKLIEKSYEIS
jgi:hypothetical protein